tara:strand:+ start:388 stop:576 length:189 start_codon:yes stop_codon:yes gene_type:complete
LVYVVGVKSQVNSKRRRRKMNKIKWTYGTYKFKNKKEAVRFLKNNGHSQNWINGYVIVKEEK